MDDVLRSCFLVAVTLLLVAALSSVVVISTDSGRAWNAEDFPNPQVDAVPCGGRLNETGWVCDPDGLMTPQGREQLELIVRDIRAQCRHPCGDHETGYPIGIAALRRLNTSRGDRATLAASFAGTLAGRWGLNASGCEDWILLLVVADAAFVELSTGSKVQALFPPVVEGIITGRARAGLETNVARGLIGALFLIWDVLEGKDIRSLRDPSLFMVVGVMVAFTCGLPVVVRVMEVFLWALAALISPVLRVGWLLYNTFMAFPRAAWKMREKLHRIQVDIEGMARSSSYHQRMCAICLEEFPTSTSDGPADKTPLMGSTVQRLSCGHRFHAACIREWMETSSTVTCPLCRDAIDVDDLDGPPEAEQTYRAWLRYYLTRLYAQHPGTDLHPPPINDHLDHLMALRATDWLATGMPPVGSLDALWLQSASSSAPRGGYLDSPPPLPALPDSTSSHPPPPSPLAP